MFNYFLFKLNEFILKFQKVKLFFYKKKKKKTIFLNTAATGYKIKCEQPSRELKICLKSNNFCF